MTPGVPSAAQHEGKQGNGKTGENGKTGTLKRENRDTHRFGHAMNG